MAKARFSQRDLSRAILAAKEAGLTITEIEIAADGTIRVHTASKEKSPDDLLDDWLAGNEARQRLREAATSTALLEAGKRIH